MGVLKRKQSDQQYKHIIITQSVKPRETTRTTATQEMSEQTETAAVEQNMAENGTNGATNGGQEESVLEQTSTDDTVVVAATKTKVLNVAPAEEVPENFDAYLSETQPGDSEAGGKNSVSESVPEPAEEEDKSEEAAEDKEEE